ncbi:hypothetical protein H0R92_01095 [Treponema sp. OMZ 840]|uniref:hypothetical protein n=1 Tax=Treponema sp. OMZ 840 TaxID=244313 RepID=UPI003D8C86A1
MAIQPIDLQTLYSQLANVSKNVAFQQQGAQLQNAIQQEEHSKRLKEQHEAVEAAVNHDEGPGAVKNKSGGASPEKEKKDKQKSGSDAQTDDKIMEVIKDPRLGQHIDISG